MKVELVSSDLETVGPSLGWVHVIHDRSMCCVCIHGMLSEPKAPQLGTAGSTDQNGRPRYSLFEGGHWGSGCILTTSVEVKDSLIC